MKRKIGAAFIVLFLLAGVMPAAVLASPGSVKVSLPSFNVSLNGIRIENGYRQYPLIVYKDITYFPMTYYDCRFLGIETKWDREKGLVIDRTGITGAYRDYKGKAKNRGTYTAAVPAFDVRVNGKAINNAEEEYPLLVFRDVTYFPMTWRFAVEEFGWEYQFDPGDGLVIRSSNRRLDKDTLSGYAGGPVIVAGGFYYYGGPEGGIYQAPVASPEDAKRVYQLPLWSYGDGSSYVSYGLTERDGEAWLNYHQGGAVMGKDYYIRLKPDGTAQTVESGYLTFRIFGDITVKADQWGPPGRNNLMIKYEGQEEYERVGDPDYLYGWDYELRGDSQGGSPSRDIYLKGDYIYILAVDKSKDIDESRIHRVDISTGETSKLSSLRARTFRMDGDSIYFVSGGELYRMPADGGGESRLETAGPVSLEFGIQVLGGQVYYVSSKDGRLYSTASGLSLNPGGKVTGLKKDDGYLICTFEEESSNPYRIMVFDKGGEAVFKSSDVAHITGISIENGRLFYAESTSSNIYSTDLLKG